MPRYRARLKSKIKNLRGRPQFILKNVSTSDINIGDLRYKIPAGKCRDLFSPTAHLNYDDVRKSAKDGSIGVRLGRTLMRVDKVTYTAPPGMTEAKDPATVMFPQRIKSFITIEMGDISDEIKDLVMSEDEEYIKKLDQESELGRPSSIPMVAEDDDQEEE